MDVQHIFCAQERKRGGSPEHRIFWNRSVQYLF